MKILISTDTYYPQVNGASYFTQRLAHAMQKRGHDVLVIAPSTNFSSGMTSSEGIPTFGIMSVGHPMLFKHNFRFVLPIPITINNKIEKTILEFQPDVIHIQGHFAISKSVVRAGKKAGIPLKGTNHFMPENLIHYLHLPNFVEEKILRWAWGDFRKVFDNLHTITTPTQTAANLLKKTGFTKEVYPVSCGIDLVRFNPNTKNISIKEKYSLPDVPILLFLGRIDKEKNVDMVLEAISKIPKDVKFHFAIAGNGAEKKNLQKLTKKLGLENKVTFLGFVPDEDLPALYATSDCFVNAGIAELQCIAMMEAMASKLPVLGVNRMALPELCHDKENGFLFEENDISDLSNKITKIMQNEKLRKEMGEKSLEIIQAHEINKTMERFEFLYKETIKTAKKL